MADPTTAYATDPYSLTSKLEMEAMLSSYGVDVLDSETPLTPQKWELAIGLGSDEVMLYCQRRASGALLAANRWARGKATIIACYHISGFAGESHNATFAEERDTAKDQLEMVAEGKMDIPGIEYSGLENKGAGPVGSNLAVDLRVFPSVRVVPKLSSGQRQGVPGFPYLPGTYRPPGSG